MAAAGDLLVILPVPFEIAGQVINNLLPFDLLAELGRNFFPLHLWHQSASCLYPPALREPLLEAFETITANSFTFQLDRLQSTVGDSGIHWALVSSLGAPFGFNELISARCSAFSACGIDDGYRNTAHLTTSYRATHTIQSKRFPPVLWRPEAIELAEVKGKGRDYRYETIATRALGPPRNLPSVQSQLSL